MGKRACCSDPNHPKDRVCLKYKEKHKIVRPVCSQVSLPWPPKPKVVDPTGGGGTSPIQDESPLVAALEAQLNAMERPLISEDFLMLAQTLLAEGFYEDALACSEIAEDMGAAADQWFKPKLCLTKAQSLQALGKVEAAQQQLDEIRNFLNQAS
jgi:hypothetical protein